MYIHESESYKKRTHKLHRLKREGIYILCLGIRARFICTSCLVFENVILLYNFSFWLSFILSLILQDLAIGFLKMS